MQVVEPGVRGGTGRLEADATNAGGLGQAQCRVVAFGRSAIAIAGLGLSLLIILVVPNRAADTAPGRTPRLSMLEWGMLACILASLIQAVRWLTRVAPALAASLGG